MYETRQVARRPTRLEATNGPMSPLPRDQSDLTRARWALVNTMYALKYARIHYVDHDRDGFDAKQEAPPTYSDFAYLAFTIGMAYSAPDVEPDDTRTRRTALPHALLSYFFGTVLIATTLNLVTNLAQS